MFFFISFLYIADSDIEKIFVTAPPFTPTFADLFKIHFVKGKLLTLNHFLTIN